MTKTLLLVGLVLSIQVSAESVSSISLVAKYIPAPYSAPSVRKVTREKFAVIEEALVESRYGEICSATFLLGPELVLQHPFWEASFEVVCDGISGETLKTYLENELSETVGFLIFTGLYPY